MNWNSNYVYVHTSSVFNGVSAADRSVGLRPEIRGERYLEAEPSTGSELRPENAGDSSELSLRGLPGVYVLVEDLDDDAKRAGLDRDQIQTDVELKRRLAGIKILTRSESLLVPGGAYLYVRPTIVLGNGLCIFSVEVALHQGVLLERDNAILVYGASTWSKGNVGATWQSIAASTIRSQIADKVDKFLNAYLAVNPKK